MIYFIQRIIVRDEVEQSQSQFNRSPTDFLPSLAEILKMKACIKNRQQKLMKWKKAKKIFFLILPNCFKRSTRLTLIKNCSVYYFYSTRARSCKQNSSVEFDSTLDRPIKSVTWPVLAYLIGQFQCRAKLYAGILFIGSGPACYYPVLSRFDQLLSLLHCPQYKQCDVDKSSGDIKTINSIKRINLFFWKRCRREWNLWPLGVKFCCYLCALLPQLKLFIYSSNI